MGRSITKRQRQVLNFIKNHVAENNVWPTYKAFVDEFGFRSPNSVTQNIRALVNKGYIRKTRNGYVVAPSFKDLPGIPVMGIVTAGQLQEAVEANLGTITLESLVPNLDRVFALRVSGQSMRGVDIHDGDYVLLVDDDIPDGGIGAVMYNGETSLKKIFMDDYGLRLEPANPEFDDIRIDPDLFEEVTILGRYIGHVNRSGLHKPVPPRTKAAMPKRFSPMAW